MFPMNEWVMNTIKLLSFIFVLSLASMAIGGCVEETPEDTPSSTAIPNATGTVEPTVTIPQVTQNITPEATQIYDNELPTTYIQWIDGIQGFTRIRAFKDSTYIPLPPELDILNFSIKVGDSVRWVHEDTYNFPLTVVSNDGLWANRTAYLRWQSSRFEYLFNQSGTYSFSIKGYQRIRNQTITITES